MAVLLPNGKQQFFDDAGNPLAGGKVYTYAAGTTTLKTTWSDAGETAPNTNPVILNARGEATIFWNGAYKVTLTTAADVPIWTVDGVNQAATVQSVSTGGTGATSITANKLVRGNGTSPFTASIVHDTGTQVGVDNASPIEKLDVNGNVRALGFRFIENDHLFYRANSSAVGFRITAAGPFYNLGTTGSSNMVLDNTSGGNAVIAIAGVPRITVTTGGNVAIASGAATPATAITATATTTINCTNSNVFRVSMGTNITTLTVSNPSDGQTINVRFVQDATGSRTVAWPASFKWPGASAGVLSTAANAVDLLVATYYADTGFWYASLTRAFA